LHAAFARRGIGLKPVDVAQRLHQGGADGVGKRPSGDVGDDASTA
jgi:hypothetical protein